MSTTVPTETPAGRAWFEKYLHSPSVKRNGYIATPDNNMSPITTLEFDSVFNVSPIFTVGDAQYYSTDIMFLQSSGARVIAYVFVRDSTGSYMSGNWLQHPQTPAVVFDQYDFDGSWGSDVQMQRLGYKSCTYYLNATQFNDQGTVTIAQFRPNFFQLVQLTDTVDTNISRSQLIKRSSASSSFDFNAQVVDIGHVDGSSYSGAYVPATSTMVQQSSPKAVTHMARDGAFVPQHWSQPINMFYNQPDAFNGSELDMVRTYIRFITADSSEHFLPLYNSPPSETPTLQQFSDTVWSDFTWAYVMFSGLSVPTGESMANAPYVTVKSYAGVEVQPSVKSSFVFFQQPAPIPDDRAIHLAAGVVHQKPDGYPASANDFGSILGLVANYAPKVIDWIGGLFKKKEPAPATQENVKIIEDVVRKFVGTSISDKPKREKKKKVQKEVKKIVKAEKAIQRTQSKRARSLSIAPRPRRQQPIQTMVFERSAQRRSPSTRGRRSRFDQFYIRNTLTQPTGNNMMQPRKFSNRL